MEKLVNNYANTEESAKNEQKETSTTTTIDISQFQLKTNCYVFPVESNQSDRTEALKCIEIALEAFPEGQYDKAERFILKSLRICDSQRAKSFLETVRNAKGQHNNNVNVETEKYNEHVNNHYLGEEINEYNKCIQIASKAFDEGDLVKHERFLSKASRINSNADAREHLKRFQDSRASQHWRDEAITPKKNFVSFAGGTKTSNINDDTPNNQELDKQQSKKSEEQIERQKLMSKNDLKYDFKPIGDLDNLPKTTKECVKKAQKPIDEKSFEIALHMVRKDLMQEMNEKLSINAENPEEEQKGVTKNIVKKDAHIPPQRLKKKEITSAQITEIQRVEQANDDYGILGIPKGSALVEVDKAYKYLTKILHPDKNNAPGAEDAFMKVKEAKKRLEEKDRGKLRTRR